MDCVLNFFFSGVVKSAFEEGLSDHLQLPVTIEQADIRLHGCSLKKLTIGQPPSFEKDGELIKIDEVKLKHSWINLLFNYHVTLSSMKIKNPMVHVIKRGLLFGNTNIQKIPEIKPPRKDITIEKLKLRNVKVKVSGPLMNITYPMGSYTLKNINRNRIKEKYGQLWKKL